MKTLLSRNICREKPVFAGKVTCGVRNETSGQSWPSNTVATDLRAKPEFKVWQRHPAETSVRLAKDFVLSVSNASLHKVSESISYEVLLPTHQQAHMPSQPSPLHSHSIAAH